MHTSASDAWSVDSRINHTQIRDAYCEELAKTGTTEIKRDVRCVRAAQGAHPLERRTVCYERLMHLAAWPRTGRGSTVELKMGAKRARALVRRMTFHCVCLSEALMSHKASPLRTLPPA